MANADLLIRASIAICAAAVALTFAACGKGDSGEQQTAGNTAPRTTSTTPRQDAGTRPGVCRPVTARAPDSPRSVASGQPFRFEPSGELRFDLRVERTIEVEEYKDRYTSRKRYRPENDARLVIVVYRFANRGRERAEAASTVNAAATLADARGVHYRSADSREACVAASPSAAVVARATSPEKDVSRNGTYRTVAVYAVPKDATGLRWTVGPVQVRLPAGASREAAR